MAKRKRSACMIRSVTLVQIQTATCQKEIVNPYKIGHRATLPTHLEKQRLWPPHGAGCGWGHTAVPPTDVPPRGAVV